MKTLPEVLGRRASLVARAQSQRERLSAEFQGLRGTSVWVDRGMAGMAYMREHPLVLVGAGVVILVVFRRPLARGGWVRLIQRGFVAWRGFLALRAIAVRLAR